MLTHLWHSHTQTLWYSHTHMHVPARIYFVYTYTSMYCLLSQWHRGADYWEPCLVVLCADTWSTWPRSTWRRTTCVTGCAWWPAPRRRLNCATSRSTRMRKRRKEMSNLPSRKNWWHSGFVKIKSVHQRVWGFSERMSVLDLYSPNTVIVTLH